MEKGSVSIITVFHQRRELCRSYLRAWTQEPAAPRLLLGDAASSDGTREVLQRCSIERTEIEFYSDNLGFARANNRLARRATGTILIFLNYDVAFLPGWLDALLEPFVRRPHLGIMGNVQLSVRSQAPDHAGIFFNRDGSPFHFRPVLSQLAKVDLLPVPAVTGACLAIRRDLFETIGGFHDGYHNSYEDIELCLRARLLGYEVAVATKSVIWHYIGASPGRQDREKANAALFESRCGSYARKLSRFRPPHLASTHAPSPSTVQASAQFETLQVFYDHGDGFREEDSTVHLYRRGRWNRIEIAIPANRPIALRFDPGRTPGYIRFGGMAVKHGKLRRTRAHVRSNQLAELAEVGGTARRYERFRGLAIESTGHDPQLSIRLESVFPSIPDQAFLELWLWSDERPPLPAPLQPSVRSWRDRFRRISILADLHRLSPGGVNGGVKVFVIQLLQAVARRHRFRLSIDILATAAVCAEIRAVAPQLVCHACDSTEAITAKQLAGRADVLYAPLGYSDLSRDDLPQISLLVDFLHRDIPGALPDDEVAIREKWFVETISRSAVLQCNSNFVVERLRHHYGEPAARPLVVYNAVGQRRSNRSSADSDSPYFFYPANDWPHKNHERLLDAYAVYKKEQDTPWRLKLSGHFAHPSRITSTVEKLGLSAHVDVLGHLPDRLFTKVFTAASALVFPSRYEGFGIPVLEAFRLEVPVVCSRTASLPEIGADACGYFNPDDIDSIADAMKRISTDRAWRETLIVAGRRRARDFSLEAEADKLAEAFIGVARRR